MRQKEVGPDRKFDRLELMQKEAEALRHALALVEEEENEALQKARKQKARKAKKKGGGLLLTAVSSPRRAFCDAWHDANKHRVQRGHKMRQRVLRKKPTATRTAPLAAVTRMHGRRLKRMPCQARLLKTRDERRAVAAGRQLQSLKLSEPHLI